MTRILIVDDHDFFRGCLIDLINTSADLHAVGECCDGSEVIPAVEALVPDVVLMDLRMQHRGGLDATSDLQRSGSAARVILLTSTHSAATDVAARARGAWGCLTKGLAGEQLLDAVRRVAHGDTLWPVPAS